MIDPKELMIGNVITALNMRGIVVIIDEEEEVKLLIQTDVGYIHSRYHSSKCEPIKLSAAVLEACGFTTDEIIWSKPYDLPDRPLQFEIGHYAGNYFGFLPVGSLSHPGIEVKHLHQLQNLFFSITGQLLEIDIDKLKNAINEQSLY